MGIFADLNKEAAKKLRAGDMPEPAGYKIGDRIASRFEIYRILGGGMGVVYVCYDHESKNPLVLKTFQDKYLYSKSAQDSFKKEALLWIHLERHPYIVRALWV
ncbi:hypothetical protein HWQ67_05480, partial [Candidatus Magnetobacterium casensis]